MADFSPAIENTLNWEGGLSVDSADPGGTTNWGISQRSYPELDIVNLSRDAAIRIYERDWWNAAPFAEIESQAVANKFFDLAVNVGASQATKLVQRACNGCGQMLNVDGQFGHGTLRAINAIPEPELLTAIRFAASRFYQNLVQQRPADSKFLAGWLRRAAS